MSLLPQLLHQTPIKVDGAVEEDMLTICDKGINIELPYNSILVAKILDGKET